jgi:hypothetical protein
MTRIGTANLYYADYGLSASDVEQKIADGEIYIGKPPLKPGERLAMITG